MLTITIATAARHFNLSYAAIKQHIKKGNLVAQPNGEYSLEELTTHIANWKFEQAKKEREKRERFAYQ